MICTKCNCDVTLEDGWLVCYHTVVRQFDEDNYPDEWKSEDSPDFGSCSSCGGEVQFGKMAEHTCPNEKGKE